MTNNLRVWKLLKEYPPLENGNGNEVIKTFLVPVFFFSLYGKEFNAKNEQKS